MKKLIPILLCLLCSTSYAEKGVWITTTEIQAITDTSSTAWTTLNNRAKQPIGTITLSDNNSNAEQYAMAKALVWRKKSGALSHSYVADVRAAVQAVIGTECTSGGDCPLYAARNLCGWVIAADLVPFASSEDSLRFRVWITTMLEKNLGNTATGGCGYPTRRDLRTLQRRLCNNWGTHATASVAAIAVFLDSTALIDSVGMTLHGYLGDRSTYAGFCFDANKTWHADQANLRGINSKYTSIQGHNVDGAVTDDMYRNGSYRWPPPIPSTSYHWGGLNGALVAAEILYHYNSTTYPTYTWEDKAIFRAANFLWYLDKHFGATTGGWWIDNEDEDVCVPIINKRYSASFRTVATADFSKNIGWTSWTHQ